MTQGRMYTCPMHPEVRQPAPGSCPKCGMALEPVGGEAPTTSTEYVCPMHPQIVRNAPGSCPICGMALEPRTVTADEENAELKDMTRRFWVSVAFSVPLLVFVIGDMLPGQPLRHALSGRLITWLQLVLATPVVVWGGWPFFVRGWASIVNRSLNMFTLIALGTGTAYVYSVVTAIAPGIFPESFRAHGGEVELYFEAAAIITTLVLLGQVIELRARSQTSSAIKALLGLTPKTARRLRDDGGEEDVSLDQVRPGDRFAGPGSAYLVPAVVAVAVISAAVWGLLGPEPRMAYALVNAVAVLIIACPCALGLATPMSIMVATGRGALAGVLIKNAEALEILERIDTLVVDKTGTLTEGRPRLVSLMTAPVNSESDLLRLAASLERGSEHPLAGAIVAGAEERKLTLSAVEDFRSITGKGVVGRVEGQAGALGNHQLMQDLGVPIGDLAKRADALRRDGQTVMFVAVDGRVAGLLGVADPIKESTPEALRLLRESGVRVVMLTGDNRATAEAVARKLGITEIEAEVLPEQKIAVIKRMQAEGRVVAMAGDGVNDAPALAQAHVGIAMGTGTDVPMESAGITLVKGDLRGIVRARRLSQATMRNIRENLFFAFIYNALGVPIAAGVLYPVFGLLLSPIIASAAMSFSSVSVIFNALRLRRLAL